MAFEQVLQLLASEGKRRAKYYYLKVAGGYIHIVCTDQLCQSDIVRP